MRKIKLLLVALLSLFLAGCTKGPGLRLIETNVGMSLESIILLVFVVCGGLVFYAKDFQLGLVIQFILCSAIFAWFYYMGWNYKPPLIYALMTFVIMCLSLYATNKLQQRGGFI